MDETLSSPAALHAGFRLRFSHEGNDGLPWDYWHVDDVILEETSVAPPPPASSTRATRS